MSAPFLKAVKVGTRFLNSIVPAANIFKGRRTYYAISNVCPIPDTQLKAIIDSAVTDCPSVWNIQAARAVLLTGTSKDKLWEIVKAGYLPTLGGNGLYLCFFALFLRCLAYFNTQRMSSRLVSKRSRGMGLGMAQSCSLKTKPPLKALLQRCQRTLIFINVNLPC